MARWSSLLNLRGTYTSPPLSIPLEADGVITKIYWDAYEPQNTSITIQTRISFNGVDWTDWKICFNNGQIPDIDEDTSIKNIKLMYRVIVSSPTHDIKPKFIKISFEFEPILVFNNKGDVSCQPEIWITKINNGDFSIQNLSHNNEEFKFTNLIHNETVYVDNEHQDIETSLVATYRFKDFNDNYLSFPVGKNILRIEGHAEIKFRYQYKYV